MAKGWILCISFCSTSSPFNIFSVLSLELCSGLGGDLGVEGVVMKMNHLGCFWGLKLGWRMHHRNKGFLDDWSGGSYEQFILFHLLLSHSPFLLTSHTVQFTMERKESNYTIHFLDKLFWIIVWVTIWYTSKYSILGCV